MDVKNIQEAMEAREQGIELYKKGKLEEAVKAYEKAANLMPSDPSPLSLLSAVTFEAGKYSECVDFTTKAVRLLKDDPATATARKSLLIKQAKVYLHLSKLEEAEKLLDQLNPSKEREDLSSLVKESKEFGTSPLQSASLREAILQLPRFKPSIQDEPEYFGPGHDKAESLYTPELEKSAGQDPVLSIMLCGVGDARHFFQTLLRYSEREKGGQKLCVTMIDHKPAVMARILIFFSLLQEATVNTESRETILLSLSYLYCTQIIPPFVWEMLQETINNLVLKLEKRQQPLSSAYLLVSQMDMIVRQLKTWQKGLATEYKTSAIRAYVAKEVEDRESYPDCRADHQAFRGFSVMFPPLSVLSRSEPELSTLVTDYQRGNTGVRKRISDYLDKHWKVNPTLVDEKWQARYPGREPSVDRGPSEIAEGLIGKTSKLNASDRQSTFCILKHVATFFEKICQAILSLKDILMIEMITGDMVEVVERLRYGIMERPKQGPDSGDREPSEWPQKYHVAHMSNIPDYVGGSLMSFLYASHVLKEETGMGLTSCVLINPGLWPDLDHFNAEYLLMHNRAMIQKHFSVRLAKKASSSFLVMREYQSWERRRSERCSLEQLMPRAALSKWLFAHVLKICLPSRRPAEADNPFLVYAPINMTWFPRLLVQMAELGYPGHWLSNIIVSICDGEITTTARAPREYVLGPAAVDKVHASRTISVKPWAAEFSTLITQWRALLPFAVVAQSEMLPLPETIVEYSIRLFWLPPGDDVLDVPHFMLVFWNQRKYGEPVQDIYRLLLDDEEGDRTTSARKIRADGIKIVSTFNWVSDARMATFWLRSDVMDMMIREDWHAYMWRTDSWVRATQAFPLKNHVTQKRTWKTYVASME
ncbi:hypothetical protein F5Y13DRAFT_200068 [Hypoxylon sp. FL1857]|nr:hypothetical protein F5Y13DRAFT_200068 [Hypoxylon sp. FL1857]